MKTYFEAMQRSILREQDETSHFSARPLLIGSTRLVSESLAQAQTLGDAMRRCASAFDCLHGGYFNRVEETAGALLYRIDDRTFPYSPEVDVASRTTLMEGVLIYLHTLLSQWAGRDLAPDLRAVHSRRSSPLHAEEVDLLEYWEVPVRMRSATYGLEYRPAAAGYTRSGEPQSLQSLDIYDAIIERLTQRQSGATPDTPSVRALEARIRPLILTGSESQVSIARRLGMSVATLRRRLAEGGTCFRTLRAQALNHRAKSLLDGGAGVAGTAQALGFSDARSFSRAFKQWNGVTPAHYDRSENSVETC